MSNHPGGQQPGPQGRRPGGQQGGPWQQPGPRQQPGYGGPPPGYGPPGGYGPPTGNMPPQGWGPPPGAGPPGGFPGPGFGPPGPLSGPLPGFGPGYAQGIQPPGPSPSGTMTRELGTIQVCVIITAIALVVSAGFKVLATFALLANRGITSAYAVGNLLGTLLNLGVIAGFLFVLLRFAGSISAYRRSPTPGNLETAFGTHNTYWKMWGIVTCVVLFLGLLLFSIVLAAPHLRLPR